MQLKPVKARRLYEEVLDQIRELMAEGTLKPGDKLLSERELAERLEVSRASVREAIRALEIMGALEIRQGGGTFVRDASEDEVIRPLAMFLAVERSSLLEMFEVRRIFETEAARLAATRATEEERVRLRTALGRMRESVNLRDSEKGEEFDVEFHHAVTEATHNDLLIKLLRTLSDDFSRVISAARRKLYSTEGNPRKIVEQHRRILEAIEQHDGARAAKCMLDHLTYAEREYRKHLP